MLRVDPHTFSHFHTLYTLYTFTPPSAAVLSYTVISAAATSCCASIRAAHPATRPRSGTLGCQGKCGDGEKCGGGTEILEMGEEGHFRQSINRDFLSPASTPPHFRFLSTGVTHISNAHQGTPWYMAPGERERERSLIHGPEPCSSHLSAPLLLHGLRGFTRGHVLRP